MEGSSILDKEEEGQWLDFLPAKTSEEPGRVVAEEVGFNNSFWFKWEIIWRQKGVGVMSELGRIFFSNSALTINLTPFILIATLATLGMILIPDPDSWFSIFSFQCLSTRALIRSSGSTSSSTEGNQVS